jgi:hypothetical protein
MDRPALADRLYAQGLAAPLRTPSLFHKGGSVIDEASADAYLRKCSEILRKSGAATAADIEWAIEQVEKSWKGVKKTHPKYPYRVVSLLSEHARSLLRHSGRDMVLEVNRVEPGREILRWRFISLALPPGILIAAATRTGFTPPEAVRLLDASIAPDQPVAHNHIHHAAMMSFEELWASLQLRALLRPAELKASLLEKRAFCPGLHLGECLGGRSDAERHLASRRPPERAKHMAEWGDLIRQAFIARRALDRHSHHPGLFKDCRESGCREALRSLGAFLAGRTKPYRATPTPYPWPEDLIRLARRYRRASAPAVVRRSDARRRELILEQTAEERDLLVRAFAHLRPQERDSPDSVYERLFVQYLRVKTALFGLLVQPSEEHGLANFIDHFQQIKVYAPESDLVRPRRPNEPGLIVRATEYRVAPDAWFEIIRRQDREIEEHPTPEADRHDPAWLVHFKRSEPDGGRLPLYGSAVRKMESEADQIARALDAKPVRLRTLLRGIDICGVEEAQPLWVSAETLRRVRARSSEIAGRRPGLRLEPLRLTLHAGEDFSWLTSGIRAIAEPFHWKLIERGDRIGHGMAITLEPEEWWRRREGQVFQVKRIDRLLDLAFLAEYAKEPSAEQEAWLREEIKQTVIYLKLESGREPKAAPVIDFVETAKKVWFCLGGRLTRRLMETPHWNGDVDRPHEKWIHSLLWRRSTQEYAAEKIYKRVDDDRNLARTKSIRNERDLLVMARKRLIREVARWQVCIESNPSSNLIVGGLEAMGAAQDFLQQRPVQLSAPGKEKLTWTISTDDPITFSTTLADEYAYAWAGMVLRDKNPYDPSYARALLDEAAATSMRMRFTIAHPDRERTKKAKPHGRDRARPD